MGGNAFTSGPAPLSTPRMPPELYFSLRNHYINLLRTLYQKIATPIEAPGKDSYGDIDILVACPCTEPLSEESVATSLKASRAFTIQSSPTTSFAVPHPQLTSKFVQVDVHVCPDETFQWQMFHQSHGDLWNLLGTAIRPVGLTANDSGLHLRIEEIEPFDRKRSLVVLTREPREVVEFLGLQAGVFDKRFCNIDELYRFASSCRFFDPGRYRKDGLKANDRKRMAQRKVYQDFVERWIPEYCGSEREENAARLDRSTVLKEALEIFRKERVYDAQLRTWRQERAALLRKQGEKVDRKRTHVEIAEYADAWTDWLAGNE